MRITLTILLASLLVPNTGKTAAITGDRPNILFIIADDQSPFDLKVYNPRSELQTPNIDRLAAKGMVFDGAHHMGSWVGGCLLYTSPSPRDGLLSRMPSSA